MTPVTIKNNYFVLIVKPEAGCSTKDIFAAADSMDLKICDVDGIVKALEEGDDDYLAEHISNSLQDPAISLVPTIQTIIDELKDNGLKLESKTTTTKDIEQIKFIIDKYKNNAQKGLLSLLVITKNKYGV